MAIEKNAQEVVEAQFADELRNGTLIFRTIDISEPKNEAIAEKYEVTWSSLFISKWKAGKETYENLTEYAFANARTAPATFKNGVAEKVRTLLNKVLWSGYRHYWTAARLLHLRLFFWDCLRRFRPAHWLRVSLLSDL